MIARINNFRQAFTYAYNDPTLGKGKVGTWNTGIAIPNNSLVRFCFLYITSNFSAGVTFSINIGATVLQLQGGQNSIDLSGFSAGVSTNELIMFPYTESSSEPFAQYFTTGGNVTIGVAVAAFTTGAGIFIFDYDTVY